MEEKEEVCFFSRGEQIITLYGMARLAWSNHMDTFASIHVLGVIDRALSTFVMLYRGNSLTFFHEAALMWNQC